MKIVKELFDDPINFFKKKRDFKQGFILMVFAILVFVALNQAMIQIGFVAYQLDVDPLTALAINFATLLSGYFTITTLSVPAFKYVGGRKIIDLYKIVAYSLVPISFLWIPHILPQTIILFLSLALLTRGVAIHAKTTNRRALIVTASFIGLSIVLSLLVRNFVLPLLYFV